MRQVPHRPSPELVTRRKGELAWNVSRLVLRRWKHTLTLQQARTIRAYFIFRGSQSIVQQRLVSTWSRGIRIFSISDRISLEQALCTFHIQCSVIGIVTRIYIVIEYELTKVNFRRPHAHELTAVEMKSQV